MATLGKNQVFEIKNGDGTSFHNLVLRKSAVESIVMSLGDKISGDVYYKDNSLSVTMHEYITYNGVNYMLVNPPTIVREGIVSDNSELKGMTKYSFVFYHPMYQLANFPFSDVAVTSDETRYLGEGKTFSWIGKPADFVAKLNKNLTGTEWIVELSSRFPQDKLDELSDVIPFDNATIADACKTFYDTWGVPYVVDKVGQTEASYASGKRFKIVMGLPSNEIYSSAQAEQQGTPFVFQMGHGVGLKNNSRTPRNNKIITRISGYGSENNIPYGYPQVRWYGTAGQAFTYGDHAGIYTDVTIDGVHLDKVISYPIYKGILDGEYVELIKHPFTRAHLMPSVYRTCLFNKISFLDDNGEFNTDYDPDITLIDYYDAVYSSQYPYPNTINLQAPSYESHEFEDEKPELGEAHIISATPLNNDLTPASSWDDSLDDEGNYKQSYFQMVLPQLSFDLYACASITEEMQINMRSGTCLGCTFNVQVDWDDYKRNFYDEEGNFAPNGSQRDLTKYPKSNQGSISLVLQKDNSTFGTLMPNMYQYPKGETSAGAGDGDTFVLLGISLPESYIFAAEWRLDADMKSYMLENNVHYFDYPLKFDEDFLFHNENILSQIRPNTVVRFNYAGQTQALFVKQITVKYGDQPLPQYDITLTDNVEVVLNQIGHVAEDVEKLSTLIAILRQSYGKNVWSELAKKLSKTQDDTAAGYITMLKGLQVGANFVPDILGEGGVLRMREDGKVELVTDILYARVKAYFDSVEIREYQHTCGNRIASVAGNKICRVAWFNSSNVELEQTQANLASVAYFRCYFRASDGEDTVRNNWVIGDQAYCHITSVTTATDNPEQKGLNQKHLWRLVIGRNTEGTLTEDGEAYIDLSNRATEIISGNSYTGYQSGSDIPEAQDDIIQLGNVNDTTRQGAIVEFVTGTDAPSYQIYQGINSFSLNNKNQIGFGYNTGTGRAYLNVYGDFRFGSRSDNESHIKYNQATKQLDIKANVTFTNVDEMSQFVKDNQNNYNDAWVHTAVEDLQSQIDGEIDSWFYNYLPVADLNSKVPLTNKEPYKTWYETDGGGTASEVTTERTKHLGDTFYDNSSGYAFRFSLNENTENFEWNLITDSAVVQALANAAKAQETADGKRTTYSTWNAWMKNNVNTLEVGDLFIPDADTTQGGVTYKAKKVYKCTTKGSSTFEEVNYTDDTRVNGFINELLNGQTDTEAAMTAAIKAIRAAVNDGKTTISGGLVLTNEIAMRDTAATPKVWSGISGMYDANVFGGGIASWWGGARVDHEVSPSVADYAKSLVRFDGSGYFAGGNITWDAQGRVAIKDITTLIGNNNTNVLNELTTFNNAFHFTTSQGSSTILSISPQAGFDSLSILENGTLKPVATKEWVNGNFVTKTFFDNLFRVYNGAESAANKIDVNGTLPSDTSNLNIEAMFGFWTKKYISALGQGDDGSTSYTTLAQLNDVNLSNPTASQVLSYNGTHWVNKSIELGSQTLADLTDVMITSPAANQILGYDATNQKWINVNVPETYTLPAASTTALGGIKIGYSGTTVKTYAVVLDSGNKAYVSVPWENTWTAWAGATSTAAGTAGYMPAPTSAQRNQFLRGDGTWVSLNNYSLPTASADTLGGVKVGTTLAIASGVLNLPTTGVTAGTYKRVTVDAYGRVTSGDNSDTDTNTWRNIYVGGTSKVGTGIDTKAINFKAGSNVSISYVAAGTGSGQSGNANYFDVVISATDTTYSAATQSVAGLMSAADKKKLDGIAEGANKYSLPLAASGTRGGVQIGFTTDAANRNYAVQLSSEKMFVNVPWVNTWRGIQDNLTSTSTTDSLSAKQGKTLKGYTDTLFGYFSNGVANSAAKLTTVSKTAWGQTFWTSGGVPDSISGALSSVTNITMSGYIKIGDAYLSYDSTNNAIRVSANANGTGAVNFYAVGGVSALGETADGQAGVGDVTWALLAEGTDTRQIALSHLTTSLTTITGGTTDSTNKKYAVYKNSSNQLFVDVPWQAGSGTVTSVKVGATSYTPDNGVISLPAYPTSLPASDVYSWAKQSTKPTYAYSEITGTPTIPAAANNGTFSIKTLVGSTTTTISDFTANQSTADDFTLVQGDNVTFTLDTTNRKLTIKATDTTYSVFTASANGLVPMASSGNKTSAETAVGNYYLCADGKFRQLPANAFLNNTYTVNNGSFTIKSKIGTTTTSIGSTSANASGNSDVTLIQGTNVTFTNDATNRTITIAATDTTYSANNGVGLSGTTFYNSGVRAVSINGNYLRVNTNGTNADLTIPYATSAGSVAWGNVSDKPLTLTKNATGFSISGGTTSKTLTVSESYTLGAACAKGVTDNSSSTAVSSTDTNLITARTLYYAGYVKSSGVTSVATGTGLSGGTITTSGTISIDSTYQTYISHGESAYNSLGNYYSKYGGSLYGEIYFGDSTTAGGAANPSTYARIGAFTDHNGGCVFQFGSNGGSFEFIDPSWSKAFVRISTRAITNDNVSAGYTQILHPLGSDGSTWPLSVGTTTYGLILGIDNNGDRTIGAYGSTSSSIRIGGNLKVDSGIEIYNLSDVTPFIDFHYNNSSYDYTSRILETSSGILRVEARNTSANLLIGRGDNGDCLQIGLIQIRYDSANNALRIVKNDGTNANLYATGGISALGVGQESGGGGGDVTWALLASQATGGRYIHQSYISGALSNYLPVSGGAISGSIRFSGAESVGTNNTGYFRMGMFDESNGGLKMQLGGNATLQLIDKGWTTALFLVDYNGNGSVSGSWSQGSDARFKTIIKDVDLSVEQIAKMPAILYRWNDREDTRIYAGSIAQNWESVLPQVTDIGTDPRHFHSLQYGVAALISAITVARKVMTHEEKIALLETRVSALEKENGEQEMLINSLQEELAKFKAA